MNSLKKLTTSTEPVYKALVEQFKEEIGQKQVNDAFYSERELAKEFNVSRMTARKIINILVEEGYLYRILNKGTFVADINFYKTNRVNLSFFNPEAQIQCLYMNFRLSDPDVVEYLQLPEATNAFKYYFLAKKDKKCISLDEIHLLEGSYLSSYLHESHKFNKVVAMLKNKRITQQLSPVLVPVQYAKLMGLEPNTPIIMIRSIVREPNGQVLMFIRSFLHPTNANVEIVE